MCDRYRAAEVHPQIRATEERPAPGCARRRGTGQSAGRGSDIAAQPTRRFHGTPYLALRRMARGKQRIHCLGV
jgi:hypothetical protein